MMTFKDDWHWKVCKLYISIFNGMGIYGYISIFNIYI